MDTPLFLASGDLTHNLSIFDPASPTADSIRTLSILVFAITGVIFLVVEAILFYSVFRFWRRGRPAKEPPQVYGSQPIEIAWTAAPTMVVFILVLVTARTLWEVNVDPPAPEEGDQALFVTVVGRQWWWEYNYGHYNGEELDFVTANELHVPAGTDGTPRPIYLTLKSADVCHSFWVPRLSGKTDLIPGRTNTMSFRCDRPGLYVGQCAEYCGTQHANMLLRVVVEPPDEFQRWLDNERKLAAEDAEQARGKSAFLAQSCVNCHRVRGTPARGTFGPDLTHLMSRQTLASGLTPNTPDDLRRWIEDPQKVKVGCLMPAFNLDERDLDLVVRYLGSLR